MGSRQGQNQGESCNGLHSTLSCSVNLGGSPSVEGPAEAWEARQGVCRSLSGRYTEAALHEKMGGPPLTALSRWPGRPPTQARVKVPSMLQGQAALKNKLPPTPPPCLAATSASQQVSPTLAPCLLSLGSRWTGPQ